MVPRSQMTNLKSSTTVCDLACRFNRQLQHADHFKVRASIEDEYARKLQALCRKSLGSCEIGSLRSSLDVVRGETEAIAKAHAAIAGQMKTELEEPLSAFASGIKERRKIIQQTIERLHKTKMQQTQTVNKVGVCQQRRKVVILT